MREGFKHMATRIENARVEFVGTLMALGAIDQGSAFVVMERYLREKIAKLDAVNGKIRVTHGAFLDREVIRRAAATVK